VYIYGPSYAQWRPAEHLLQAPPSNDPLSEALFVSVTNDPVKLDTAVGAIARPALGRFVSMFPDARRFASRFSQRRLIPTDAVAGKIEIDQPRADPRGGSRHQFGAAASEPRTATKMTDFLAKTTIRSAIRDASCEIIHLIA